MMKYSIKTSEYNPKISIYLTVDTSTENPIEIEEDLNQMKEFRMEKYYKKEVKIKETWRQWWNRVFN